jgi:uncharacterized protein (DUF2141 family)
MSAVAERLALVGFVWLLALAGCGGGRGDDTPAPNNQPPAAPTGVVAAAGNAEVTITWPAVAGATSYTLYWSTSAGVTKSNGTQLAGVTTPYVHDGCSNATTYYYVLTASNANGESADSSQVSATPLPPPPPPAAPTGVAATPGNGVVTVAWNAVAGTTSYDLYWSTMPGVTQANGTKIANASRPYVHGGLSNGTTYYYVVTAVGLGGASADSTQASATPSSTSPPAAPTGFTATGGPEQITLSWSPVSGATSYNVYCSDTPGITTAGTPTPVTSSPHVRAGVTAGTDLYCIVTAENGYGESPPSAEVSARATQAGYAISGSVVAPAGSGRIYLVASCISGCTSNIRNCGTSLAAPGAYTIRGVPNGTYTVRAYRDTLGHGHENATYAAASRSVQVNGANASAGTLSLVVPTATSPAVPTGLSVTAGDAGAAVQWRPNTDGNGIVNVTGYDVAWGTDVAASTGGGSASLDASRYPIYLVGLANSQAYYFKIRARNAGFTSAWSAAIGPVTIGPWGGGSILSGIATLPVDATGPVYALAHAPGDDDAFSYLQRIPTPGSRSVSYSISGLPAGTYSLRFLLDQNQNGVLDPGELMPYGAFRVQVTANTSLNASIPTPADAHVVAPTYRLRSHGTDSWDPYPQVWDERKIVATMTIVSANGLPVPIDLGRAAGGFRTAFDHRPGSPGTGESIGIGVTYTDGTSGTFTLPLTAVDFARNLTVTPTPSATVPTFSWTAPAIAPTGSWGYSLSVQDGGGAIWTYPPLGLTMPSSQTSVQYDVDGTASDALSPGSTYGWSVTVRDAAGNSAETSSTGTP